MERETAALLAQARRNSLVAATPPEKFRWLVIIAILEGLQWQNKPGSSTSAKAS